MLSNSCTVCISVVLSFLKRFVLLILDHVFFSQPSCFCAQCLRTKLHDSVIVCSNALLWLLDRSLFACGREYDICVYLRNEFVALRLHKSPHRSMLSYGNSNLSGVCRNFICMPMSRMQILCQKRGVIIMIWNYCVGIRIRVIQLKNRAIENRDFITIKNGYFRRFRTSHLPKVYQGHVYGDKVASM